MRPTMLLLMATLGVPAVARASDCTRTSTGRVAITDLGAGEYLGAQGGLYPGGSNVRPASHDAAGRALAASAVVPRDADGNPDPVNGKVVLVSIGMSNTTQEFQAFVALAASDPTLSSHLVVVDGAQGGKGAAFWQSPTDDTWTVLARRLEARGVTPAQVQAAWIKQQFNQDDLGTFPAGTRALTTALGEIARNLVAKYPNTRIAFVSARGYAGYSETGREVGAYENAWAVKWLIEDQMNGAPALAFSGAERVAPWLAWGPYFWADGLGSDGVAGGTGGRADGLEWACEDFQTDGIHPGPTAEAKIAGILRDFLAADPAAAPWFLEDPPTGATPDAAPAPPDAGGFGPDGGGPGAGSDAAGGGGGGGGSGDGSGDGGGCLIAPSGARSEASQLVGLFVLGGLALLTGRRQRR